ncbi:LOW QUALITY PROTEIN: F-box/LRR-repeat protein 4-like [Lucilia sericata]|uniref:LOW QUALITY PROTEIN: F-box/LRR-repeat protein 4-like n=1 Tax=Lucilia sericata TaxID=13632 RepID=UPI0018A7FDAA|nr:LOW QUALITY PROTEIN: F-box/LRR-repeat protein 4-like [Lucilia sericata]
MSSSQSSASAEDDRRSSGNKSIAVDTIVKFPHQRERDLEVSLESDDECDVAGAMIDVEGFCYADYRMEQYAHSVLDFSSQYGIDLSISYTAPNITGRPSKYPEYGDFPQTFAMRTYGDWWDRSPSRLREISPQNLPKVPAEDFIVLYFEDYVIPDEIAIFETFNPGAVIRIWAYTIAKTWICLWEDNDFYTRPPYVANRARRFAPPLKRIQLPTKTIRLEFNHQRLHYNTEIDAVLLNGQKIQYEKYATLLDYYERQRKGSILCKLQNMKFRPVCKDNYQTRLQHFLMHDLDKFMSALNDVQINNDNSNNTEDSETTGRVDLKDMPFDIVLKIFSYLDLISLFRVGQVSRFFYDVSTHPLLYSELNLKPYWHLASTELLSTLAKRATILKKLDMSWCGCTIQTVSPTEFKKFIQQRGDSLTHIRLNSAKFLNASCIETLGIVCDNLRELSLRNCSISPPLLNFSCLANLKNLERLDLFQTVIESDLLLTMLESNPKLKHLNLAFCNVAVNMDDVALHISQYNKQLVSLDLWKAHFLSAHGLIALSECHDLEEVDFGWCLREATLGDSLKEFLTKCPKLKKLFLAAVRGLTDRDLEYIANLCPNLEQLDLMGVLGISKEKYYDILQKCKKLQLMDLSFCDNIMDYEVAMWSRNFKVNIKCCHVPNDFR